MPSAARKAGYGQAEISSRISATKGPRDPSRSNKHLNNLTTPYLLQLCLYRSRSQIQKSITGTITLTRSGPVDALVMVNQKCLCLYPSVGVSRYRLVLWLSLQLQQQLLRTPGPACSVTIPMVAASQTRHPLLTPPPYTSRWSRNALRRPLPTAAAGCLRCMTNTHDRSGAEPCQLIPMIYLPYLSSCALRQPLLAAAGSGRRTHAENRLHGVHPAAGGAPHRSSSIFLTEVVHPNLFHLRWATQAARPLSREVLTCRCATAWHLHCSKTVRRTCKATVCHWYQWTMHLAVAVVN